MLFKHSEDDQVYRAMLPPMVRKMITREVELEHMRRSEGGGRGVDAGDTPSDDKTASKASTEPGKTAEAADAKKPKAFVLPELTEAQESAKAEAMRRRNPFAFAHREAKRKREQLARDQQQQKRNQDQDGDDGDDPASRRSRVRYKFNEGYTSGIKTTVYMRDLF